MFSDTFDQIFSVGIGAYQEEGAREILYVSMRRSYGRTHGIFVVMDQKLNLVNVFWRLI